MEACDGTALRIGSASGWSRPTRASAGALSHQGGGWVGRDRELRTHAAECSKRHRSELGDVVGPGEFAGSSALVVGGSRGLGEVTAKLLAAGGAKVMITYRVGSAEAEAVARDICAAGGECETLAYDACQPAEPQLAGLGDAPTHAYYFATPTIFRAQSALFARARLDAFLDVYVDGFLHLAQALRARRNDVSLFYPSSVYVAERPRGMLEYAMAKAAGETLCAEMNMAWAPLHVTVDRLPRLPTDQTASVMESCPSVSGRLSCCPACGKRSLGHAPGEEGNSSTMRPQSQARDRGDEACMIRRKATEAGWVRASRVQLTSGSNGKVGESISDYLDRIDINAL